MRIRFFKKCTGLPRENYGFDEIISLTIHPSQMDTQASLR